MSFRKTKELLARFNQLFPVLNDDRSHHIIVREQFHLADGTLAGNEVFTIRFLLEGRLSFDVGFDENDMDREVDDLVADITVHVQNFIDANTNNNECDDCKSCNGSCNESDDGCECDEECGNCPTPTPNRKLN